MNVEQAGRFTYYHGVGLPTCQACLVTGLSVVHVLSVHADLARLLHGVGESDPYLVLEVIVRSMRRHIPYRVQDAQFSADQAYWDDWVEYPEALLVELVALGAVVAGH
jgi:hypothetical protein